MYEEDRIRRKRLARSRSINDDDEDEDLRSSSISTCWSALNEVVQVFRIMEGACVGLLSDIVITPILLFIESVGVLVLIPVMIVMERDERNKIHR